MSEETICAMLKGDMENQSTTMGNVATRTEKGPTILDLFHDMYRGMRRGYQEWRLSRRFAQAWKEHEQGESISVNSIEELDRLLEL